MKKRIHLIIVLNFIFFIAKSQDIVDPYMLRDATPYNDIYEKYLLPKEQISQFEFNTILPTVANSGMYTGELMVSIKDHHWFANSGVTNYAKSYSVETVSFPFTMNCFDNPSTGCAYNPNNPIPFISVTERKLFMPDDAYNGSDAWGDLKRVRTNGTFRQSDGMSSQFPSASMPEILVSRSFTSDSYLAGRNVFPHTVLKFTVNLHCGVNITDDIVDSFSWVYDNTRGMMRCYPFYDSNLASSTSEKHDVLFAPLLVEDDKFAVGADFVNLYSRTDNYNSNTGGTITGGTIDYFPFTETITNGNNGCMNTEFSLPSNSSEWFSAYDASAPSFPPFEHYLAYEPPYLFYNTFLRNNLGTTLAGYYHSNVSDIIEPILSPSQRMPHEYFINRGYPDVDLTLINPSEKIIFNPSEVTIKPDAGNPAINVIFPTGYTFKTIIGRYPSVAEVNDANADLQSGGPFDDLRQVCVPVNASDGHANDPVNYPDVMWDNPNTPIDDRFGYYYIDDKATLTVEQCTRIYDARFEVRQGGTLFFEDHNQELGYEDKSYNTGRYKIRGLGGAVLRNHDPIQYVQNGIITQTQQLHYHATDQVVSGYDVDPDTDQPDGEYEIEANGDVVFTAINEVHLADGFHAKENSTFHAYIDPVINANICPAWNAGNQRMAHSPTVQKHYLGNAVGSLMITPNPGNGEFLVYNVLRPLAASTLTVSDVMGHEVFAADNVNGGGYEINLIGKPAGIYFVKLNEGSRVFAKKIVLQ